MAMVKKVLPLQNNKMSGLRHQLLQATMVTKVSCYVI